jgi:4-hydroxy-2-oxoheptanedioate aldolase
MSTGKTGSKMLKSNRLKQVFTEARRPAMGFWQMLPGANISRVLARSGADWVMVDCEHGNMDGRHLGREEVLHLSSCKRTKFC